MTSEPGQPMQGEVDESKTPSTPRHTIQSATTCCSSKSTSNRSVKYHLPATLRSFQPYPGNPFDVLDSRMDAFLTSRTFELICVQATQLAALLPCSPPPTSFTSFDHTPMHHWYQAILMEFIDHFMTHLRIRNAFPLRCVVVHSPTANRHLTDLEDADAFNAEATAHINAILASFNRDYARRGRGCTDGLQIDSAQRNAMFAALALHDAIQVATWPPKRNWRMGEPLHAEYKRRLRMFESGFVRLVAEREDLRWALAVSERLERGVGAYKEYYIACLREEILKVRSAVGTRWSRDTADPFL